MTKKRYLDAMHAIYRRIYAIYGDKESYSLQEGLAVVDIFLAEFPAAFGVPEERAKSALPAIKARVQPLLQGNQSLDEMLYKVSLVALRETQSVSRFFALKPLWWSLFGAVTIAPDECGDR